MTHDVVEFYKGASQWSWNCDCLEQRKYFDTKHEAIISWIGHQYEDAK